MESLDTVLAAHRAYLLGWNVGAPASDDLPIYRSEVPHAPLNGVLRVSGRAPRDALAEARDRLDGVPRIWWAGPDSDAGTADALLSLGAVRLSRMPIMTVATDRAASAPMPAGLRITETTDLSEFVPAYGRVSGISRAGVAAAIERESAFSADGTVIRLAARLDDDVLAGTTVAWLSHDLLTLYFVGTQPEQRSRGVASALTTAALDLARERGVRTAALTSTSVAESLYHRIGFRTAGTFDLLSF
ncbi:GNAT family N-acetyltransferase [Nonomuraea terrae]|uniref:GNAT family N-acetyltransferase n=1 Tax=Nonomuraea terrae TaxID=2530383 RepID=A0A4R4YBW1_9ACTN|nr:GNAT family N-acetyltransferase [Nonomuraea terrae]TDD41976.1 GNAT family N-acetyltransferase [Nonomuraea terrae]